MSYQRIIDAALLRFAAQGFDGTSISQLAGDVGLQKSSIYSHFSSKEALFTQLVEDAARLELEYTTAFFQSREDNIAGSLLDYLHDLSLRFENTPHMRFWLMVYYLPPASIHSQISPLIDAYVAELERLLCSVCAKLEVSRLSPEELGGVYQGIVDNLLSELLYGNREKFEKRLSAFWKLFSLALSRK